MTTSCQKNYTITVASNLLYYWTLDEPNPTDNRVDSSQSVALQVLNGGGFLPPTVSTGLFGNGVRFNNPAPQSAQMSTGGFAGGTDTKINYTQGQGLTAWGWIKLNGVYGNGPLILPFDWEVFSDAAGVNRVAEIEIIINSVVAGTIRALALIRDDLIGDSASVSLVLPVGTWAFFAARFDTATGLISVRFNNSAWTAGTIPITPKTGAFGFMAIATSGGGANFDCTVDEVGVVKKVLTDTQVNNLFNGGVGVTWPTVQAIVS